MGVWLVVFSGTNNSGRAKLATNDISRHLYTRY